MASREEELKEKIKGLSREEAAAKLDEDFEAYLSDLVAKQKSSDKSGPEKPEKSIEEILQEVDNHPAFMKEIDYSKPFSPDLEGLMRLKFEDENPTAKAESYKEEGNYEFKKKQYRIAIENYTEGIKCKCPDRELNAVLYSNRAACQYHLGNYRSSLQDSILSRRFKSDHMKAILRGAMCCMELKKYDEVGIWCDAGLLIDQKHEKILEMKLKSDQLKTAQERDKRKEAARERKELEQERKLISIIQSKGIKLAGIKTADKSKFDPTLLTNLETHNPSSAKVHEESDGSLSWPVLFMYPEHTQTDFIEGFNENHRFIDHVHHMFGPDCELPPWDIENKYKPNTLQIYFEDKEKEVLCKLDLEMSLLEALRHERYIVHGGTPCFILMVEKSPFMDSFVKRYQKVVIVQR